MVETVIVTGGAGFIGSAVIRHMIAGGHTRVVNVDKLTYAGNLDSIDEVAESGRYCFELTDICDRRALDELFARYRPDAVMHLAAESHVDRSIDGPAEFVQSNILGTYHLLEAVRHYLGTAGAAVARRFRFHHISTDEVYGDLDETDPPFTEHTPYRPSSPYAASKAGSDHLVRAWGRTYGIPFLITNCSNNYGPYQFPEKLIPHIILNARAGRRLPVYGDGKQVRDWLYVKDHAAALELVLKKGECGQTYNIGGCSERRNIDVVHGICEILEELAPDKPAGVARYTDLIEFVKDRPGHDRRYAIDCHRIREQLGWEPEQSFESGLRATVKWYLENTTWWRRVLDGSYRLERLGREAVCA